MNNAYIKTDKQMLPLKNAPKMEIEINGCNVKLNFPSKSERNVIGDVKKMILSGITKV